MPLTVKFHEKTPGVYVVYPVGSLDTNTSAILEKQLDYLIFEGSAKLVTLDMDGLEYISSAGIRVIFKARKFLQKKNGNLVLVKPQPQVLKVFEIINALPSLPIFSSIKELDDYLTAMQRQTREGKD